MTVSVKSLQKQLLAAIAMVLVAAVALGSSTYAWFVSNNTVKATTTNISAQSNSAYLVIDNAAAGSTKTTSTSAATASETFSPDTKLYPAQWMNTFDSAGKKSGDEGFTTGVWQFESAYASVKDNAGEKDGTRFAVGNPDTAAGKDYTLANTFYIGTGTYDGTFTNLKVAGLTVNNTTSSDLNTAIRVLVTCGDQWVVARAKAVLGKDAYTLTVTGTNYTNAGNDAVVGYLSTNSTTTITKSAYEALSDKTVANGTDWEIENQSGTEGIIKASGITKGTDATVKVYVYYDGSDGRVFTTNLENLKDIGVTVTFEATPKEFK